MSCSRVTVPEKSMKRVLGLVSAELVVSSPLCPLIEGSRSSRRNWGERGPSGSLLDGTDRVDLRMARTTSLQLSGETRSVLVMTARVAVLELPVDGLQVAALLQGSLRRPPDRSRPGTRRMRRPPPGLPAKSPPTLEGSPRPELSTKRYSKFCAAISAKAWTNWSLRQEQKMEPRLTSTHLDVVIAEDGCVDSQLAEFVLGMTPMRRPWSASREAEEQGGFSGSREAGEDIELGAVFCLHGGISFQSGAWGRASGPAGHAADSGRPSGRRWPGGRCGGVSRFRVSGSSGPWLLRDGKACAAQELPYRGRGWAV